MKRRILRDKTSILEGVNSACDCITSTMGPQGKYVLIEREDNLLPLVTKDGATVAEHIDLKGEQNLGVQVIKEASKKTALVAGDGTTTAALLSQALYNRFYKDSIALRELFDLSTRDYIRGINSATEMTIENLESERVNIDDDLLERVAEISANGEKEVASIVTNAIKESRSGEILVTDSAVYKTHLSVSDGFSLERGFLSPHFITDMEKNVVDYSDARVLLVRDTITSAQKIFPVLEHLHKDGIPLLIISDMDNDVVQILAKNRQSANLKISCIKPPGSGQSKHDMLTDLSILTKSKIVSFQDEINPDDLGYASKITTSYNKTVIVAKTSFSSAIQERVDFLRNLLESTSDEREAQSLSYRIRQLSGKVVTIHVGGYTDAEVSERKDRVDDALRASLCAIKEGVLPGAGTALFRASHRLKCDKKENDSFKAGFEALIFAASSPMKKLIQEDDYSEFLKKGRTRDLTKERDGNFLKLGVIDPYIVTVTALRNAVAASTILMNADSALVIE